MQIKAEGYTLVSGGSTLSVFVEEDGTHRVVSEVSGDTAIAVRSLMAMHTELQTQLQDVTNESMRKSLRIEELEATLEMDLSTVRTQGRTH